MPSYALAKLSAKIESQSTDNFGKFYLYATLLRMMTVRKEKSFLAALPKYRDHSPVGMAKMGLMSLQRVVGLTGRENSDKPVHTGSIDGDFVHEIDTYTEQFTVHGPDWLSAMKNICFTFVRKGQVSDLIYILERMHGHLLSQPMALDRYNKGNYDGVNFESFKNRLQDVLSSANRVARYAQDSVDNAVYGFASIIVAILAVKLTMMLGGLILTAMMLTAGALTAAYFLNNAYCCFNQIEQAAETCAYEVECMIQTQNESLYAPNYLSFVTKGVLAPLAYIGVTSFEQTAFFQAESRDAKSNRTRLDRFYQTVEDNAPLSAKL